MRLFQCLIALGICMIAISGPANAELMEAFVTQVFNWKIPDERPHLLLSRGMVLAWLKDPSTFMPIDNAQGFYNSGDRSLVIVPPGTALLAFPPRTSRGTELAGRLRDVRYQLAVTRDGLWGVIDTGQRRLFLDEPDLAKIAAEEKDADDLPKFGMLKATAYTATSVAPASPPAAAPTTAVDQPIALTRGELFRILEEDGDQSVIDFNANVPVITSKFASAPAPRGKFSLPANRTAPFRITNDIVPHEQMEQWRQGKAAYSRIFAVSFANLRVPALAKIRFGCGDAVTLTRKDASNRDIKAGFEVSVGGSFWTWVKAGLNSSGSFPINTPK
jgi:hypothetical protein